jgi:ABC-type sugar transport system substrate-binding protein
MRSGDLRALALGAAASLLAVACGGGGGATNAPAATTAPSTAAESPAASGLPYTATLKDGSTFTLNPRIVDKLAKGEAINYVFSYGSTSIPLFSPQYLAGYNRSIPEAQKIMPINGKAIAPASALQDANEQIAQITALLEADQIDCLSVQSTGLDTFTKITNDIMAKGIPVFTVGVQSNGNEFTNFTQISEKEGAQAANIVIDWMKKTGNNLKVFAVSGGDPTQNWAQGRMKGFVDTMKAAVPDATFLNTEANGLQTSYDPAATYDAYKAFIQGNPTVQFIENVDIGAEHADRAIKDAGLTGKVFTIGWNVSVGQLDAVKEGTQVAALDQRWGDQAAFGAVACAELLKNGKILPNTQELLPITQENEPQAREEFMKIVNG